MRQPTQAHEHFEELCAVAVIGQLTAQEQQELLSHLGECDICRRSADDFVHVLGTYRLRIPQTRLMTPKTFYRVFDDRDFCGMYWLKASL